MTVAGKILMAAISGMLALSLAACEKEGPAERAGEEIDEAVEQAKERVEESAEEAEEGMEEAGEKLREKTGE